MQRARINLASPKIEQINTLCESISQIADKTNVKMYGPVPLPTKRLKVTTRKSPCGDGKASFDRYEMRIHKRLIDLDIDERALRLIMRLQIPEDIDIQIQYV